MIPLWDSRQPSALWDKAILDNNTQLCVIYATPTVI